MVQRNYFIPTRELNLNLGLTLMILNKLSATKSGIFNLDIDRITFYLYFLYKPLTLNKVLEGNNKSKVALTIEEKLNISSQEQEQVSALNTKKTRIILSSLSELGYLIVNFNPKSGFTYSLSIKGAELVGKLKSPYFRRADIFITALTQLQSIQTSKIQKQIATANISL